MIEDPIVFLIHSGKCNFMNVDHQQCARMTCQSEKTSLHRIWLLAGCWNKLLYVGLSRHCLVDGCKSCRWHSGGIVHVHMIDTQRSLLVFHGLVLLPLARWPNVLLSNVRSWISSSTASVSGKNRFLKMSVFSLCVKAVDSDSWSIFRDGILGGSGLQWGSCPFCQRPHFLGVIECSFGV